MIPGERIGGTDAPTTAQLSTFGDLYACCQHPAFRIGFLDAQAGRPLDHDAIVARIQAETNPRALARIGWDVPPAYLAGKTALAQYRYEEGRIAVLEYGCRCRAWGHPDYPPRALFDLCWRLAAERGAIPAAEPQGEPKTEPAAPRPLAADFVAALRSHGGPSLLDRMARPPRSGRASPTAAMRSREASGGKRAPDDAPTIPADHSRTRDDEDVGAA